MKHRTIQLPGRYTITCCLDDSIIQKISALSNRRYMRENKLIDHIVRQFDTDWDDIKYFNLGDKPKSFLGRFGELFTNPKPRSFVTYQVMEDTFTHINMLKERYHLNRSMILKHMIEKYLKVNG